MAFVPELAPLVVLTFLGSCALMGVLGLAVLYGLWRKKPIVVRRSLITGGIVAGGYVVLLLSASWLSQEKVLAMGEWKYFCEVDCHMAYSVTAVTTVKTVGVGQQQRTARGVFYVVKLKGWFDENTISARRPRGLALQSGRRDAWILDEQGQKYAASADAAAALASAQGRPLGSGNPFDLALRPGESHSVELVFDVPADVRHPRLLLAVDAPVTLALIGHENSLLHKKVLFVLGPSTPPQSSTLRRRPLAGCS